MKASVTGSGVASTGLGGVFKVRDLLKVEGMGGWLVGDSRVEKALGAGVALGSHNPKYFLGEC